MLADVRPSWSNPRVLTILILVFLAGAFTGAVGMRYGLHERLHPAGAGISKANKDELLTRCKNELNLTTEQTRQMADVVDDTANYYQTLQDQLADVRSSGKSRIMALLNEEQKQKFERMLVDLQKRQ
jgi:hypothetical protein